MGQTVFVMDGISYNVHVEGLTRKFSVQDSPESGRTQDMRMYRDILGTVCNYEIIISRARLPDGRPDDASLDAFWDAISAPVASHRCTFPYNQQVLTQEMYVTSGTQELLHKSATRNEWGGIKVSYIAMAPKEVP